MSVTVNDSIQINAPKSIDNKYLNLGVVPYSTTTDANTAILSAYRSRGLTVLIGAAEYWYRDDISDVSLIPKGIPSVVAPLSIDPTTSILSIAKATNSTDGYLALGDWTTFNNKLSTVATAFSVTNTGVSGNPITLVNDQSTPGFSKLYGTNSSGVKGWYPIPVSSGGGSSVWGGITGTFSDQTDAYNLVQSKEPAITVGTTSQYWRGDKSWQTLNTSVVPEGSNPYFTVARARAALSAGLGIAYNSSTGVITSTITQADGSETKLTAGTNVTITGLGTTASPYIVNTSGGGTVTSVGLSSTDFTISGTPVVASGIITANLTTTAVTAGSYTLTALTVDSKGRITAATNGSIPVATASVLGAVKIGTNVTVAVDGTISVAFPNPIATISSLGYIKVGSGVNVAMDGTISVTGYTLPIASGSVLGGIKVGSGLAIDGSGVLSSTAGGGSVTSVGFTSTDLSVTGSPITGAGTFVANLTATGVGAGTYNNVTVDVKGRVTSASTVSYLTANQSITLSGDVAGTGATSISTTIQPAAVTYSKIQNVTQARLLGRYTASNGAPQEITVGSGLTLNSSTGVLAASGSSNASSGTYTPTYADVSSTSAATAGVAVWTRIDNLVTVHGAIAMTVSGTAGGAFTLTIPTVSVNASNQGYGFCSDINAISSGYVGVSDSTHMQVVFGSSHTGSGNSIYYTFTYLSN